MLVDVIHTDGIYWDKLKLRRWSTWPTQDHVAFRSLRNAFDFCYYLNLFIYLLKKRGKSRGVLEEKPYVVRTRTNNN